METETINDAELEKLYELAFRDAEKAGCPIDQMERPVVNASYVPYPWQWKFHAAAREADEEGGPVDIGAGGARGPGKSHVVLSQVALDDCQRQDGLKCLFLRQTGISAQESFDDLIEKAIKGRTEYHKTKNSLKFPNGSKILLGGFADEKDIDKYIGIEYDIIIVEELNQLTIDKYEKLRGSLRTSKPYWRPRMYTSFNPGGVGHMFVKERYVIPYREGKEKETRFIPSTYKENPSLNDEYIKYLESLGGDLGRAWREGEWDLFAGQFFTEWNHSKHVCEPFTIPDRWPRFLSIDPSGRSGTTSCHWYTVDSDGTVYVYREHFMTDMDMDEHAEAIARKSKDSDGIEEPYRYGVIDSSAYAKAGYSETGVEIYQRHGVGVNYPLVKAEKERIIGWNVVHQYLRIDKPSISNPNPQPKLKIFKTCPHLIKEIPIAQHDEKDPEDIADMRNGAEHLDALDDLRYFLRTLKEYKLEKEENAIQKRIRLLNQDTSSLFPH